MIAIQEENSLLKVNVYGEFTMTDYQEFEQAVSRELETESKINLLMNLSEMAGFTLDVAWEDIKFTKSHYHDFERIAVVTTDQWLSWMGWLGAVFTDADIQVFDNAATAESWLLAIAS